MAAADPIPSITAYLRSRIPRDPEVGIICGSGLSGLGKLLANPITIKYSEIQGFPESHVQGHIGELVFGTLGGKYTMCMRGRFHYYSGWTPQQVAIPVRVMAALGCSMLVVTNAAGGVNPAFKVGDVMIIKSHIYLPGLAGVHPLVGANDDRFGPRFPAVSYDEEFFQIARDAARTTQFPNTLREGVYCGVSGPTYETLAEIDFLRMIKGDAVGMSTVPEVVVAAHSGMRILGLSLITNQCKGQADHDIPSPTHQEVLDAVAGAGQAVERLVSTVVANVDLSKAPQTKAAKHFANVGRSKL
mmetsp:Transcript_16819/g.18740  ORF Transcript_16819/g.18740 Transcript_16819/m.18740 type:complete len:301 (-) Transcript_16819:188-1090(-)|eukprot:CAMPEP_0205822072 /NCGR_PEP_ID=MMETSP0206-20130828/10845_1 /ASSEMBLY_ACC=CAM_ASM_000279 /TAXON_ID=36767 /ORGANISM="Euplotes focardii, Strain TN1" /LENGTH=300 /DNA_ID=CAMNT_0053118025 /DNA_START=25 /DNA_END=927 /DNA_ORIENTATION=-